jgi:hypothetical protein
MPENPMAGLANVLNTLAPHNVLRQMLTGTPLMPAQEQAPAAAAPAAASVYPEGIRERWATRKGMSMAQLTAERAETKVRSEKAGFSVQGSTIIF